MKKERHGLWSVSTETEVPAELIQQVCQYSISKGFLTLVFSECDPPRYRVVRAAANWEGTEKRTGKQMHF